MIWLLTCEHYSNGIPLSNAHLFTKAVDVLESHRGYDIRVAPLYIRLEPLFDQAFFYRYSRLLIEPNRSIGNRFLFSPFTAQLSRTEKAELIHKYYMPYRQKVESFIKDYIDQGILHISLHSFHPRIGNRNRETPIGIRFNDAQKGARALAHLIKKNIESLDPSIGIRFHYPYQGERDSFTHYLYQYFPSGYSSIVLEVRNDLVLNYRPILYEALANVRGILQ